MLQQNRLRRSVTPLLQGMQGMGDSLYQRAVLKYSGVKVALQTPWPQIYADLPHVKCLAAQSRLRTQAKNEQRSRALFGRLSVGQRVRRWHYVSDPQLSILQSLAQQIGANGFDFRGPVFDGPKIDRPYVVVRPVCLRREWTSDARNPAPEYIARAIEYLRRDFTIVSVADLQEGQEWALDPLPYADVTYHAGELNIEQLLGLVQGAAAMVGGVGWIVPAALSYSVPLLLIYGGWGFSNGPQRIFGPGVRTDFIDQVMPDAFCHCNSNRHLCNKHISGFDDRARAFAAGLSELRANVDDRKAA